MVIIHVSDGCQFCGCDGCRGCSANPWRECDCGAPTFGLLTSAAVEMRKTFKEDDPRYDGKED